MVPAGLGRAAHALSAVASWGCNFLFCDGHASSLAREEIKKELFYLATSRE
jgi:prepilin-type processing-associated H-X9-DG protein